MRSWAWTSSSSQELFEAGWCVVARPALLYPPYTRRSVPAAVCPLDVCRKVSEVMCPRILPGSGTQIGWAGWLRGTLYRV